MRDFLKKPYLPQILIITVLLLAAAVRFHHLEAQSFWYDEGVAYGHSQRSLFELLPALQNNVHVPAYFGTLALWEDVTGSSEFALRAYSALWSVLGVAATYALGKRLYHPMVGVVAATFVSLNTFNIYYAQEARMYAMLATIAALSMWAFVGFVNAMIKPYIGPPPPAPLHAQPAFRWALAFALLNTVGAYTHVSYALVMLAQGVLAVVMLVNLAYRAGLARMPSRVPGRAFLLYTGANLLTLALFAPWLVTAITQISAQPNISDSVPFAEMARTLQGWLAYGLTFPESGGTMGVVVYFLLIFGLILPPESKPKGWWALLLPVVWVLVSVIVYTRLELYTRYLRFLLPAQMAVALWMGRGAWMVWRIVPRSVRDHPRRLTRYVPQVTAVVAVAAFCLTLLGGLDPLYNNAAYQRDDYRQLAALIEHEGRAGDAVILSAPGLQEIFGYYYEGELPVYPLPAGPDIEGDTGAIIYRHSRIFVVLYGAAEQDPQGLVTATLNRDAYPIRAEWLGNIRLERYASPGEFPTVQESGLRFGDHITLVTYALSGTTVRHDDVVQVQLRWMTDAPLDTRYKVFVQLLDSNGALALQRDSEPGGGQLLTTLWQPGDLITDNHALAIPPDLPPGEYTLIIGLYDRLDGNARLPVGDANYLELGTVVVRE